MSTIELIIMITNAAMLFLSIGQFNCTNGINVKIKDSARIYPAEFRGTQRNIHYVVGGDYKLGGYSVAITRECVESLSEINQIEIKSFASDISF